MYPVVRQLLYGQLALFIGLFLCLLLIPHFLFETNEGGISNYGTIAKTIVPFTLAFGFCGFCTIVAAASLPRTISRYKTLHGALLVLGVCYFLVLSSTYPYKLNRFFDALHVYAGLALIIWEMAFGSWLVWVLPRNRVLIALFTAQWVGFLLAVLTYIGLLHTLFVAQCLMSVAFGLLLVRSVREYLDNQRAA